MAKNKKKYVHPKPKFKQNWKDESPVKAKKHLGQHFLKDEEVAYNIAHTLSLKGYANVIEIGPGTGVLTKHLLAQEMNLVALDLDTESIAYLQNNFSLEHPELQKRKGTFKVLEADFLKYDILSLFGTEQFAITGNFPYNISTQIVFKMLEIRHLVPEFSGMFQKEVAQRICSKGGSKAFGILSVLVQTFYDAEYLFTVGPEVFNPPPKVESGVLRLVRKENLKLECDPELLFKVVKAVFNLRRKTLRNSLKGFALSDSLREDVIFDKRPEQLAVADFITLTKMIADDTL